MKLIDADIFESVLDFADADVCEESPDGHCDFGFSRGNIMELLRDIPTVDAVAVVRCRECKLRRKSKQFPNNHYCLRSGLVVYPDDFCSYGERKEGAGNA